jgi:hypothetical protein
MNVGPATITPAAGRRWFAGGGGQPRDAAAAPN